jgi:tetratricopeptide (TPR) repeat protein
LKSFRNGFVLCDWTLKHRRRPSGVLIAVGVCGAALAAWQAHASLPRWMQDAVSSSAIENALYRVMEIPGVKALHARPPKEAAGELSALIGKSSKQADLYSLRAMEEEQALDFPAAESDWKKYSQVAQDRAGAQLELADYYHRRLQTAEELKALTRVGSTPASANEEYVASAEQRSWKAFERIQTLANDQGLDDATIFAAYAAWRGRYPSQPSLYSRELHWLLYESKDGRRYDQADELIRQYRRAFSKDSVFPLKAAALLQMRRGSSASIEKALAIYDSGFEPLWPAELVQSYYALLSETHSQRKFAANAQGRLARNPDDLNAMARLFYYAQQQGNLQAAKDIVEAYRASKENRKSQWSAQELYTLATLMEAIHAYPEAARYDFALYHTEGSLSTGVAPQAEGLSAIVRMLLSAPDQPVELGANNLAMYRDMATIDRGPGYWNGILSLWLNSESPEQAYSEETQRAQPYFHRAKAAQLLATLDKEYPQAPLRAELHKELIRTFTDYGEEPLVIDAGNSFLSTFSSSQEEANRVLVSMYVADAYASQRDTKAEFALYDRMLTELEANMAGMPLTAAAASLHAPAVARDGASAASVAGSADGSGQSAKGAENSRAFEIGFNAPSGILIEGSQEYQQMLERYLGRLTAEGQLPQALAVLRRELDRNPNDPLLYERLATFLEQNNLSAQQEEVYNQAIQKFQNRGWYDKLARLYLREKKREAFADLTRKVTDIFSGTELEGYFNDVNGGGAQLRLQLNLYAHQRFPHDEVFVEHLLNAYHSKGTYDQAAWEKLIREHWSDTAELRQEFFDYLSSNGKLDQEVAQLRSLVPNPQGQKANPNAVRELAEVALWQSHFEESAPLLDSVATAYPADEEIGTETSSVFRSLAYFDTRDTEHAVTIEKRLLSASPASLERLARIGDIYSDSGADSSPGHEDIRAAAPYWRRMPTIHPGKPDGYLQAATIFWDYYQFDDAMAEIREARSHFNKPALYGYEAGAIFEGKRDMASAIHEYTAAAIDALDSGDSGEASSTQRLLQLARRKTSAKMVDDETAKALSASSGDDIAALQLRERVLEVQRRNAEIAPLLVSALQQATTSEQAQAIGAQAQAHSLAKVYELSLQRQVALASDPVQKIELSYDLARAYEERKVTSDAAQLMDKVYRENSRLLGVVRATVDFYWRNQQQAKAISVLLEASKTADANQPDLSRQLQVEAADKANEAGDYAQARRLMDPLVGIDAGAQSGSDPYNAQYIGVVAESYARAGDDAGLKKFYLDKLTSIRTSGPAMTQDERKQKTTLLRRGLIPALTRMKDYAGTVDQYIAILSSYPEDAGMAQEASLFALRYNRRQQLVEFVSKTVAASPRDSRFAIMLGQIDTFFEDYPAAIDAYAHAISIRSDRMDVYTAKADLEERMQRLDDVCKEYEKLYVLSYQNPQWMLKVAETRARQGRKDDAVKALERAWLAGHSATASDYFRVAEQLESWKFLDVSLHYAELGVKSEGDALLAGNDGFGRNADDADGVVIYTRLLTRMREQDKALKTLDEGLAGADRSSNSPGLMLEQAEKRGLASVSDGEWRKRRVALHRQTAEQRYRSAILEMGNTVKIYFTPEEKARFAQLVDDRWNATRTTTMSDHLQWLDVVGASGIVGEEAKMQKEELLAPAFRQDTHVSSRMQTYVSLERSRMEYLELAQTLDAYAGKVKPGEKDQVELEEAHAYRDAGDEKAELQVLARIDLRNSGDTAERARYFDLLLKYDVPTFESYAATSDVAENALAAPNYAVQHSDVKIARAALSSHTKQFQGQWENAYDALLGLYFRDLTPSTEGSFHHLLGEDQTIAQRIHSHSGAVTDKAPLTGDTWFYYAMRYGVYRTLTSKQERAKRDPEDFLAAGLEEHATVANYLILAKEYSDHGDITHALNEYRHALELAPDSASIHDAMALLLWKSNRRDEAVVEWRLALATLNRILNRGPAPESFWTGFERIAQHLESRKLASQLHPEIDAVLRAYIKINGNYRSEELLKAAFESSTDSAEGMAWILSVSEAASAQLDVLEELNNAVWIPMPSKESLLLRELELARMGASKSEANDYAVQRVLQAQTRLVLYYVTQKNDTKAEAVLKELTDVQRQEGDLFEAEIELAARGHRIGALLHGLESEAAGEELTAPQRWQMLRDGAARLAAEGYKAEALEVWEYVFGQLQATHGLMTSDYMGLAEARLKTGDVAGAVSVLRHMTLLGNEMAPAGLSQSDGIDNFDHAAILLVENGHDAEAIEFLTALVKGVPWDGTFALRLAQAELRTNKNQAAAIASLAALAADSQVGYPLRIQAALSLEGKESSAGSFGSEELQLLARGKITSIEAGKPNFVAARVGAAEQLPKQATTERLELLREALAIQPAGLDEIKNATPIYFTGNDLVLKIFVDEATLGHSATALASVESLLNETNRFSAGAMDSGDEGAAEGSSNAGDDAVDTGESEEQLAFASKGDSTLAELERLAPLPPLHLSDEGEKLALATWIARVYEGTDDAESALPYLKLARYLQKDASQSSELGRRIDTIEKTLWLDRQNVLRRPLIQKDLNQSGIVRPRFTAPDAAHMEAQ